MVQVEQDYDDEIKVGLGVINDANTQSFKLKLLGFLDSMCFFGQFW